MPRNGANITPQVLIWARERLEMPLDFAADACGVSVEKYSTWETGYAVPTIIQAKKIAKKMKIPYAWLFLSNPPEKYKLPRHVDYRTLNIYPTNKSLVGLNSLIEEVSIRRDVMIDLYSVNNFSVPQFTTYIDFKTSTNESISKFVRDLLDLSHYKQSQFRSSSEAFNYYKETLSEIGVLVFQAGDLELDVMRGISLYFSIFPIIIVNRKDEYNARIFSLFHEFVHILTRTPGVCDNFAFINQDQPSVEVKCNKIAAEILVPSSDILNYCDSYQSTEWSDNRISKIAHIFSVSREVIIGRLFELGKIDFYFYQNKLHQFNEEYMQIKRIKKRKGFLPPSLDICSQVGKLYARTVVNAYNQELITPRDASNFLSGLRIQHFEKVEKWCFS